MICNMCTKRTDKDSQYLETEEYKAPISRKNNDDNILKIGNHTYSFRKDILYTGEELQQLESDYQEIITQLKISNETKLSNKNKYINGIKVDIGSYLQTSGTSSSSIDTLANIGVSVTRKTVNRKKNLISDEHQQTVDDYCLQNIENMFILNIDDYHNIHRRNQPTLLQIHNIYHFVTILLNTNIKISRIPIYSLNNFSIHNF